VIQTGGARSRTHRAAALLVFLSSALTAAGGGWLVYRALTLPAPDRRRPVEVSGRVIEVATASCGAGRRRGTCYRPIVGYTRDGRTLQVALRSLYRPSPNREGDRVAVLVEEDGTAWVASEWDTRQADRERDYRSARLFPLSMGVMLLACGAFGMLLAVVLAFARD
jgi:hypothetical protein